ncbi:hypothetical protein EII22_08200 [Coriobacteriales bacterium OH1046]|nr:hypothetical protein EII22_08200 [Coriobacteriales bacterium OH1046]
MTSSAITNHETSVTPAEMAPNELRGEAVRVVRSYLAQRGFEVTDEPFSDGTTYADVIFLDQGEVVLAVVLAGTPSDPSVRSMPSLDLGENGLAELRHLVLTYAAEHDVCHAARADVIAIDLFPERLGYVRHLVRAYCWVE